MALGLINVVAIIININNRNIKSVIDDAEYEAFLSLIECDYKNYTETFTLDKNGKVTAFSISYSYSEQAYGTTIDYGYYEENTVSETVADIEFPEDADSYIMFE